MKVIFFYLKLNIITALFLISIGVVAQNYETVAITKVVSGNETSNTLFRVLSSIPSLKYIRAQRISGPQNGVFTQNKDNIRYSSIASSSGIPKNLSRIRFTFLQSDKRTPIALNNFRFIINDIDGPNNEALATNCDTKLKFLGTAKETNLTVINTPPTIIVVGNVDENEGATSRVMFEFENVAMVELDNYADDGYLKDFDLNNDYPIAKPLRVKCRNYASSIYTKKPSVKEDQFDLNDFIKEKDVLKINAHSIYFDNDRFDIRDEAELELQKVLSILVKYPKIKVELQSHTDSKASDDYNLKLSEDRSKSVIHWMLKKGVDSARIIGKGYGETRLVNHCKNDVKCTETEHQLNRRTEFVVLNPEVLKH